MSELKAYRIYTRRDEGAWGYDPFAEPTDVELNDEHVYLKSEADKVIEELKAQKSQAEDDCVYWKMSEGNAVNAMHETEEYAMQLYKELRHHKFKRCLDKAEWCEERSARYDLLQERTGFDWSREIGFYFKWQQRWLGLADKFKEAK